VKDLKTLLASDASDFERQLLGAAAAERPSPELQLRMQQAIGLRPVTLQGPGAIAGGPEISGAHVAVKAAASRWAAGTWLKVVLGIGAGAGLAAGGLALRSSEPPPLQRSSSPAPEPPAQATPLVAATAPEPPAQAAPLEAATANAPSTTVPRELREEIDLLDRVRTALDQADAPAASALLQSYAQRFPEGRLAREASVLRARTAQVARTAR
jgi:hypothetical protein